MGGDISINITIVGAQSTGKSTIVYKYTGRNYLHSRQHTKEMHPMTTIHSLKHNNKFYELCIRDTCGSSMSDIRSHTLCSNADAIIVCFNLHQSLTFERAKRWIVDLIFHKETYPILLLIGTTKFQFEHAVLSKHTKHLEAEQYAKQNNIYYQSVCLSNILDVQNIFTTIIDAFTAPLRKEKEKKKQKKNKHSIRKQQSKKIEKQKLIEKDDIKQQESVKIMTLKPLQRDPEALKIKIILLGDSGVGKTTFRRRLEINNFDSDILATIGVDCSCFTTAKKNRNHSIEILLMDPSGQEVFKNITKQYYRGCHGVILMCDITEINSWKNIKFWMDEIKRNCSDDIHIILLCNKMDLLTDASTEIISNVKLYSNMFNIKTYNISCKTGEYIKYVRKGFEELIGHIINDKQLFARLKKEQGGEIVRRLKGTFDTSESFLHVDGRPYDVNKGTIKRTCNVCDH